MSKCRISGKPLWKRHKFCLGICKRCGAKRVPHIRKPKQPRFGLSVDIEATKARNFQDPESRIFRDGRERLEGEDYKARVREVEERDGHICQRKIRIEAAVWPICGKPAGGHPHHIVKRSERRDDRAENLSSRCDECNLTQKDHPEFTTRFGKVRVA